MKHKVKNSLPFGDSPETGPGLLGYSLLVRAGALGPCWARNLGLLSPAVRHTPAHIVISGAVDALVERCNFIRVTVCFRDERRRT